MPESSTDDRITRNDVIGWLRGEIIREPHQVIWNATLDWVYSTPNTVGNAGHWERLLRKFQAVRKNGRGRA